MRSVADPHTQAGQQGLAQAYALAPLGSSSSLAGSQRPGAPPPPLPQARPSLWPNIRDGNSQNFAADPRDVYRESHPNPWSHFPNDPRQWGYGTGAPEFPRGRPTHGPSDFLTNSQHDYPHFWGNSSRDRNAHRPPNHVDCPRARD